MLNIKVTTPHNDASQAAVRRDHAFLVKTNIARSQYGTVLEVISLLLFRSNCYVEISHLTAGDVNLREMLSGHVSPCD